MSWRCSKNKYTWPLHHACTTQNIKEKTCLTYLTWWKQQSTQLWPKIFLSPTWNRPTSPIKAQQLGKISTAGCGLRCSCRISCKIRCCRWGFSEPDGAGAASRMASWRRSSQKSLGSKPCVPAKKWPYVTLGICWNTLWLPPRSYINRQYARQIKQFMEWQSSLNSMGEPSASKDSFRHPLVV